MSSRRAANNRIRGPQSALTDFLAANNISAAQINADYERRQRAALPSNDRGTSLDHSSPAATDEEVEAPVVHGDTESDIRAVRNRRKRKRDQELALAKVKQGKKSKQAKRRKGAPGHDDDDSDYELGNAMYTKKQALPGQLENCDECGVRFTVTPYSKTGAGGGLLCRKCSKQQEGDRKHEQKLKKESQPREKRRQTQSNLLDGIVQIGSRSLLDHCLKIIGDNIHQIDELGDLPQNLLQQSCQLLSKKRLLTPKTLNLFIDSRAETISLYDCGKLDSCDFVRIFSSMPNLRRIDLRFAGQFNNDALEYLLRQNVPLEELRLDAANLISDDHWNSLFKHCGSTLQSLKLSWLDNSFGDKVMIHLTRYCCGLRRLKLRKCMRIGESCLLELAKLTKLEHLSLQFDSPVSSAALSTLLRKIGCQLRTLSLENFIDADDKVLAAVRANCSKLSKFRFTGNDLCTDLGYRKLFLDSANAPLTYVDLSSNRDVNYELPNGPEEAVGLASAGFGALMEQSGSCIEVLNIHSCRHLSHQSLMNVFCGDRIYPMLREIDVSFVPAIDTSVLAGIIRCSPKLKKVSAFACFNATGVAVPRGLALIGIPDAPILQGDEDLGRDSWR